MNDLKNKIFQYIESSDPEATRYAFNKTDQEEISRLIDNKYKTWNWNFGYGPDYIFRNSIKTGGVQFSLELTVKSGNIADCQISSEADYRDLEQSLKGVRHSFEDVKRVVSDYFGNIERHIVYKFFN